MNDDKPNALARIKVIEGAIKYALDAARKPGTCLTTADVAALAQAELACVQARVAIATADASLSALAKMAPAPTPELLTVDIPAKQLAEGHRLVHEANVYGVGQVMQQLDIVHVIDAKSGQVRFSFKEDALVSVLDPKRVPIP